MEPDTLYVKICKFEKKIRVDLFYGVIFMCVCIQLKNKGSTTYLFCGTTESIFFY